jgi:hypothetical protein
MIYAMKKNLFTDCLARIVGIPNAGEAMGIRSWVFRGRNAPSPRPYHHNFRASPSGVLYFHPNF